jgi:prolyl-tRNA synthetase
LKASQLFFPTLREVPADAEFTSHKLLLRGGFIRRLGPGIYSFLPLGWRVLRKIENVMRQEFDRIGAQELLMPALQPIDLWRETGRWEGKQGEVMYTVTDHAGKEWTLGPTHEEVVTDIVRGDVRSYRQLPVFLYQIQHKFRDELRPRGGLLRCREFTMLDGYSFHASWDDLDRTFKDVASACDAIYTRCGLDWKRVEAYGGAIGGKDTVEYMVFTPNGEDTVLSCDSCGYLANVEMAAIGQRGEVSVPDCSEAPSVEEVETPGTRTVDQVCSFLKASPKRLVKTLLYQADGEPVAALVRGDRELNEGKLQAALGCETLEMAGDEEVQRLTHAPVGFAGPVGLNCKIVADREVAGMSDFITGGNKADTHLRHVCPGRDFTIVLSADLRNASKGDPCPRCETGTFGVERGIEIGHIFKLGTRYADAMRATFQDENGQDHPMIMGCYGPGVSRTLASVVETLADKDGMVWPVEIAPYEVVIIPVNPSDGAQAAAGDQLYQELTARGIEVLYDERDERSGVKFKDADLIGIPVQVVVGRALAEGNVEVRTRRDKATEAVPVGDAVEALSRTLSNLKTQRS